MAYLAAAPSFSSSVGYIKRAATTAAQKLGFACSSISDEQLKVFAEVLSNQDVFATVPTETGSEKSVCFGCLPFMFDELLPAEEPSIIVIVTPSITEIKDQVASLLADGVAAYIAKDQKDDDIKEGVMRGDYRLVFFTPEMILNRKKWRKMLYSEVYSKRLRTFIVDEAQTIKKWGETFQPALSQIGDIRNFLPLHVNILALAPIASKNTRILVARMLSMKNEVIVSTSPTRPNVMYAVSSFKSICSTFQPMLDKLRIERTSFPRIIVYCRNMDDCADLYIHFRSELGRDFTEPSGAPDLARFRLVDMYHSCTCSDVKESIIKSFTKNSPLRIVFATSAFNIDCPDVRQIIHLGSPSDMETYFQEISRAGRDGYPALSLLLHKKSADRQCANYTMIDYMSNKTVCRQNKLSEYFDDYARTDMETSCLCCDVCSATCGCKECKTNQQSFLFL